MASRISTAQTYQNAQLHVANAKEKENISAEKSATMKEIVRPSQNPGGYLKAASLKDDMAIKQTMAKNASVAMHTLNVTENVLASLQEQAQRAYEIAISSSGTDALNANSRQHVLAEAKSLFENVIQTLNTKYANRTLLAGLRTQELAFDKEGNYLGDSGDFKIEIDRGLAIPINLPGDRVAFGANRSSGVNWVASFQRLIQGMETEDVGLVRSTIDDFAKANDHLSSMRSEIAGRMTQIEKVMQTHEMSNIESSEAISRIEEADVLKVFSELARDQSVLRAAMSTSQKLLSETPTDILFK